MRQSGHGLGKLRSDRRLTLGSLCAHCRLAGRRKLGVARAKGLLGDYCRAKTEVARGVCSLRFRGTVDEPLSTSLLHLLGGEHGGAVDVETRTRAADDARNHPADMHPNSHADVHTELSVDIAKHVL